ncbi:cytochrome c oxidase subunit 3 family protein [Limibaculum sp. FT325]|uniref:cytochrome c oxidase subunit 3 family protein n=1 Tax=Thermohalobaculum sediminis TaxID=2939436 RepID=UPI0020BEDD63|nr:cytochrome c oxidase subunit 3 family protein [Limibaculum sediminis]MCL5778390.1 cytochrome c oxidase subunit 3 family protein [Limibaculum sediminis]
MSDTARADASGTLPGDLMIWVLIVSELLVFGAALGGFMAVRTTDAAGFAAAQDHLDRTAGALNTIVLLTSGLFAALALRACEVGSRGRARLWLGAAAALGLVFLWVKGLEYAAKAAQGIGTETHPFFTFYYLVTGFHAAHVVAGIVILGLVSWRDNVANIENATAFWHMVDLVWVLIFPVIYLLR